MKRWIKYVVVLFLVLSAGLFYKNVYTPKITFNTVLPIKGDIQVSIFGIGVISAKNIYQVGAPTGGKIINLFTDQGKWVKKGELLITIDSVETPLLLDEAKIGLKKSHMDVKALQKDLDSLVAQKALAQLTEERYQNLLKKGFVSQDDFDKSQTELQILEAKIASIKSHIHAAKIETVRAEKNIEILEVKLARFNVYSPIDGYVIAKQAEVAQTVLPSQVIFQIVDPDDLWVKAYIDERISGDIKVGQPAQITLRSLPKNTLKGSVKRISASSDSVTQEREVGVGFETLPTPFYMNEQAEVTIQTQNIKNVLKIPLNLIQFVEEQPHVWVYQNGEAHLQRITITAQSNQEVAVSGIDEKTKLLIPEHSKKSLTEGLKVRIDD
ncbi:MAG TPA: efflux RND transporter periplasmic adaptor subunit [Thiomicrorhabdus sp.]|nr:efflux RND transporter periplasmic adaptor subunit [Thiomicrorhabdus sp.]